jgi:hypothetical protein
MFLQDYTALQPTRPTPTNIRLCLLSRLDNMKHEKQLHVTYKNVSTYDVSHASFPLRSYRTDCLLVVMGSS